MRTLLVVVVGIATALPDANAQRSKPSALNDTVLVRTLTAGIFEVLRDELAWQVVDGRAAPWTVVVVDSAVVPWGQVQRGLRQILVRPDSSAGTATRSRLEVGHVQLQGDTAFVEVGSFARTLSPSGCVSEGGMRYLVRSIRREGRWAAATVRPSRDELPVPCK